MEATMVMDRKRLSIGPTGALARQLGLLWMSRRPVLLLVGMLGVLALAGPPWASMPADVQTARLVTLWPLLVVVLGPIWAFAVFHNEGPSSRHYHWSMPVSRGTHTLTRIAAGLIWLWAVYLVAIAAAIVLAMADGTAWQLEQIGPAGWANLLTGPLLGYLAVSILTVSSDFPIRWFLGLIFLVPIITVFLAESLGLERFVEMVMRPLTHDRWGLGVALGGAMTDASIQVQAEIQRRIRGETGFHSPVDLSRWWAATALWVAILTALLTAAVSIHPDRFPRLRLKR